MQHIITSETYFMGYEISTYMAWHTVSLIYCISQDNQGNQDTLIKQSQLHMCNYSKKKIITSTFKNY